MRGQAQSVYGALASGSCHVCIHALMHHLWGFAGQPTPSLPNRPGGFGLALISCP